MPKNFAEYIPIAIGMGGTMLGCSNSSQENNVRGQGGAVPAGRQGKNHQAEDYLVIVLRTALIGQPLTIFRVLGQYSR